MKKIFAELEALGHQTIAALRNHDAGAAAMLDDLQRDVRQGLLTERGLDNHRQNMANRRVEILKNHQASIDKLREEFEKLVDKACAPNAKNLDPDDAEILRNFELSPAEFEAMAEKHAANATMCRLLEQYRVQHDGQPYGPKKVGGMLGTTDGRERWHTDWRFQTADERKAIFNRACGTVESIIGQKDRYTPHREINLSRYISGAYHSVQGADPKALPAPELPKKQAPAMPKIF